MAGLSLWAGRERTSCWFLSLSSFLLAQQIDEVRTCCRDETCQTTWNTVVLGHVLSLGVKGTQISDDRWKCKLGKTIELREWIFSLFGEISSHAACVLGSVFWNQTARVTLLAFLHHWPAVTRWKKCQSACWQGAVGQPRAWASSCGQGEAAALSHMKPCAGSGGD